MPRPPLSPGYYARFIAEFEELANQVEQRPELTIMQLGGCGKSRETSARTRD